MTIDGSHMTTTLTGMPTLTHCAWDSHSHTYYPACGRKEPGNIGGFKLLGGWIYTHL